MCDGLVCEIVCATRSSTYGSAYARPCRAYREIRNSHGSTLSLMSFLGEESAIITQSSRFVELFAIDSGKSIFALGSALVGAAGLVVVTGRREAR